MDGRWRKLADRKAGAYREAAAYLCGVRDGAANGPLGASQAGTRASWDAEANRTGHRTDGNGTERAEAGQKNGARNAENAPLPDTDGGGARAEEAALWMRAVDATRRELNRQSPARAAFFADYYGLDAPRRHLSVANRLWRLSEKYHMTEDALKIWRREALDLLILAATQLGLLRPFDGCGEPDGEGDA